MYTRNELLLELERLEYELEKNDMEVNGLHKEYRNMRNSIIYYVVPFLVMILFYIFTIGSMDSSGMGVAFSSVLKPIYLLIGFSYVLFVFKKIWEIYCNSSFKKAKEFSKKHYQRSISDEIEKCILKITKIKIRLNEINEELLELENNQDCEMIKEQI